MEVRSVLAGISGSRWLIARFFDLRDAIEFFLEAADRGCLFVCESLVATLVGSLGWTERLPAGSTVPVLAPDNSAALCLTLQCDDPAQLADCLQQVLAMCELFGRLLARSEAWKDLRHPGRAKLFIEYYDCHAAQYAHDRIPYVHVEGSLVKVKFCMLHQQDREYLFFRPDQPPESPVSSLSSDRKTIRRPASAGSLERDDMHGAWLGASHSRNSSMASNGLSSLSTLSLDDDTASAGSSPVNAIDYGRIEQGQDTRTTCMIKNIPNKYTQQMLIDQLNLSHAGRYDFVYLRMDFKNRCNVGYAFINFAAPSDIAAFARRMVGRRWPKFNSEKICELAYARIQGKAALVDKFRNSRVMQEPPSYRPRVFELAK